MVRPFRQILVSIIVLASTVASAYTLNLLDQIVHGQLYHYGLTFSLDWADPYWNLLRIMQLLLGVIAGFTVVNAVLTVKTYYNDNKSIARVTLTQRPRITPQTPPHAIERDVTTPSRSSTVPATRPRLSPMAPSASRPQVSPSIQVPAPSSSEIPGLIKCSHCGKAFTHALRMLDFQGDRPRMVNICPFCNEIVPVVSRQEQGEQDNMSVSGKKSNNHAPHNVASP